MQCFNTPEISTAYYSYLVISLYLVRLALLTARPLTTIETKTKTKTGTESFRKQKNKNKNKQLEISIQKKQRSSIYSTNYYSTSQKTKETEKTEQTYF